MTVDEVIAYCMAKPGAEESYPFGDHELVPKVGEKSFAFIRFDEKTVAVKCADTDEAAAVLRDRYPDDVETTSYIGRFGWNTVKIGGKVPAKELRELLDESYETVVSKLPKKKRPDTT